VPVLLVRRPARTRVVRRIDADPTSTALLLAGPTAVDLWPGALRVGERDGRLLVDASPAAVRDAEHAPLRLAVRALPPRRTPTAYVTLFEWQPLPDGPAVPAAAGRLTLAYAPTADGSPVTHAVLELDPADDPSDDAGTGLLGPAQLERLAEGFLDNLARAAETRNRAA
jgi:hypothetical protein